MEPTDADLMARLRSGDHDAFTAIVDRHKHPLVNYLTHLRGDRDRAEELAQEAFVRLFQHADRYDDRADVAPYLYRIATNLVRSEFRRLRRWRAIVPRLDRAPTAPESASRRVVEDEICREVRRALRSLPFRYRAPLVLREIEGWNYQRIAEALGCREGTIKSRIARGREQLRVLLEPYWISGGTDDTRKAGRAASLAPARKSV
ncbi:MAG: RNA polymerase sigma factor [Thermoanaerobaculia bacterium]